MIAAVRSGVESCQNIEMSCPSALPGGQNTETGRGIETRTTWINIGRAQANYVHEHQTGAKQASDVQYMRVAVRLNGLII